MAFVVIEYFTRWVEAEPVAKITTTTAQKFVWKTIICRYGVPHEIITNNSSQFDSAKFKDFGEGIGTKICFALVGHPESNGAVERANDNLLARPTKRLVGMAKFL